jgi:DNA-binding response OmpR family regulator
VPRPLHILVIEDDVDLADVVSMQLEDYGHQVHVAHDGSSALMIARNRPIDAVLLDLGLPDLVGYEVARVLRVEGVLPRSSTIIIVTGHTKVDLDTAEAVGVDVLLHKPIEQDALARLIEFVHLRRQRKLGSLGAVK